jgi:hypothetical protein
MLLIIPIFKEYYWNLDSTFLIINIFIDYTNLDYFLIIKVLNHCPARLSQELMK